MAGNGDGNRNRNGNGSTTHLVQTILAFITIGIGLLAVIHSWNTDLREHIDKVNETLVANTIALNQRQDESIARSDARFDAQIQRQDESNARSDAKFEALYRRLDASSAKSDARFDALLLEFAAERREMLRVFENRRIETDQRLDEHEERLQRLDRELDQDNR